MTTNGLAARVRQGFNLRRAAIFGAACAGIIVAGGGQALASAGCTALNGSVSTNNGMGTARLEGTGFSVGDKITATLTSDTGQQHTGVSISIPHERLFGASSVSYVTVASDSGATIDAGVNNTGESYVASATITCTPGASTTTTTTTNTDSQTVRALQVGITKSAAAVSGQVITTQIDGAIGDAFDNGGNPVNVGSNGVTFNFGAEPKSEVAKRTDDAFSALGYASRNVYKAPRLTMAPYREWSGWLDLRGTGWKNNDSLADLKGTQYNVTGGIGRKLTPDFMLGVVTGYEHMKYDSTAFAGSVKGDGGSIGSYLGWRFANIRFDAALAYTHINYSAVAGTANGSFKGNRWVAASGLTGTYGYGGYIVEPSARIYMLWERQGEWTDSLGTLQADRRFSAGRTSVGSKLIKPWTYGDLKIAPYVGFYGDWRFSSDNAVVAGVPIVGIANGWSGRATAGLAFTGRGGTALTVGGEYGGIGADYKIWTANVRASMPF